MSQSTEPSEERWAQPLLYLVSGFLLFETVTGLSIWLLPFSIANQVMVLMHTGVGLIFLIPYLWYQYRHWLLYRRRPMNEIKMTGYLSMVSVLAAIVSGLVLTWQAAFGTATSGWWRNVHLISTFLFLVTALPHIGLIILRDLRTKEKGEVKKRIDAEKRFGFNASYILFVQFALVALFMLLYESPKSADRFPDYYELHHGSESPFGPSLARTESGGPIAAERLGGSQSCGTSGCHSEIYEEWEVSAHRYASADPFFREIQRNMGEQKGPVSTRYCAGCHDPIGLFSGSVNLFSDELTDPIGLNEGVSCISCHSIVEADVQGNADFVIEEAERYMFELHGSAIGKWISDFLIRAYPQQHVESFRRPLFKTSEYCGACHKQYVDEEVNDIGWVQLQNQYDNWRESHWFEPDSPITTIECRECHMPLVESSDPSSGDRFEQVDYNRSRDDGRHRSHRFLGANQFVPELLDLPNAEEHIRLTEKWLRGELEIPEIQDKWESGPVISLRLFAPDSIFEGEELQVEVVLTNMKAGHDFPTGPLDMIQAWVELIVEDRQGRIIYHSGGLDENHFIEPGAFMFRAEPVDEFGNLIDRHNLWEMVGVRHSRALFPGRSDYTSYSFRVESPAVPPVQVPTADRAARSDSFGMGSSLGELKITARLQYRKFNQFLMNEVFGDVAEVETSPITTVSEDSVLVIVHSPDNLLGRMDVEP